jgi:hypothetical protein
MVGATGIEPVTPPCEADDDASCSMEWTVDLGSYGPVGRSATAEGLFHLATVSWLTPANALRLMPQGPHRVRIAQR